MNAMIKTSQQSTEASSKFLSNPQWPVQLQCASASAWLRELHPQAGLSHNGLENTKQI